MSSFLSTWSGESETGFPTAGPPDDAEPTAADVTVVCLVVKDAVVVMTTVADDVAKVVVPVDLTDDVATTLSKSPFT